MLLSSDLAGTTNSPLHPGLAPLALSAGGIPTMALEADSPALDAGAPFGMTVDQLGTIRPQGTAYDIGAFEYDYTVPILRGAMLQNGAGFYLEGHGLPGTTYLYQACTNFVDWMDLSAVVAGTNGVSSCIDPEPVTGGKRFYRLVVGR